MTDENKMEKLKELSNESQEKYFEAGYAIHSLATRAKGIYYSPNATTEDKRLLLSIVFSNLLLQAGKITPNYAPAFEFMHYWMPRLNREFEPKMSFNFKANSSICVKNEVLRDFQDAFRTFRWDEILEDSEIEMKDMTQLLSLAK